MVVAHSQAGCFSECFDGFGNPVSAICSSAEIFVFRELFFAFGEGLCEVAKIVEGNSVILPMLLVF